MLFIPRQENKISSCMTLNLFIQDFFRFRDMEIYSLILPSLPPVNILINFTSRYCC